MAEANTAAGIFPTHFDLTEALRQLRLKHLELKQMSLAGRAPTRDALLPSHSGLRLELESPLCGTYWVTGPLANSILYGQCDRSPKACASDLARGLRCAGVPIRNAREYEMALANGQSILMAHGSFEEITRAIEVLSEHADAVRIHVDCRWST